VAYGLIQFQHGMSLAEFLKCFGTETACAEALHLAHWPGGFHCPRCGGGAHCELDDGSR
jgi:hypothetical protein